MRGLGDSRTQIMLAVGAILGIIYTVYGRVPDWLILHSGGSLVADDDPRNISPRVYLSIIAAAILLSVVAVVVVLFVM